MHALTEKLYKIYTRLDGLRVMAFIATSALGNSQNQKIPFRLLVVRSPVLVKIGDVMNGEQGAKILLLEHPSDNSWTMNFKAAHAANEFDWYRPSVQLDPVTGFPRDELVNIPMGTVWANFDTPLDETTLTFTETEYRFLTGSDVQIRDRVGGKIVSKVQKVLGVNLVYAA